MLSSGALSCDGLPLVAGFVDVVAPSRSFSHVRTGHHDEHGRRTLICSLEYENLDRGESRT